MHHKHKDAALGGILSNPVFVLVLGTCPTIAMSTSVTSAFGLGVSTALVLILSNIVISALRKVIPDRVRLPAYILIIATFVTMTEIILRRFFPALNEAIGAFISLIVVNCIIFARAESFAAKNDVLTSLIDGVSMGLGFIAAITLMGAIRQTLILAGLKIFGETAGGFIVFACLIALFQTLISLYERYKRGKKPLMLDSGEVNA